MDSHSPSRPGVSGDTAAWLTGVTLKLELAAAHNTTVPGFFAPVIRGLVGQGLHDIEPRVGGAAATPSAYSQLFLPSGGSALPRRLATPSPPYSITAPFYEGPAMVRAGTSVLVDVHLFGAMSTYWPQVTLALASGQLRANGADLGLRIQSARLLGAHRSVVVWTPRHGLRPAMNLDRWRLTPTPEIANGVRLVLESPLEVISNRRTQERWDPQSFTKKLCERLDLLAGMYGHGRPRIDLGALMDLAGVVRLLRTSERFVAANRNTRAQSNPVWVRGVVGTLDLENVPPVLLGLWRLAERLHVGGNTAFGCGQVRLDAW